jgi:hypothetical protein
MLPQQVWSSAAHEIECDPENEGTEYAGKDKEHRRNGLDD